MTRLFIVIRGHGPGYDGARPLDAQAGWPAHAAFMNALKAEGVALLAGPLADAEEALIVMRATDAEEIERRLAPDPWTASKTLVTTRIAPWDLRLGTLG